MKDTSVMARLPGLLFVGLALGGCVDTAPRPQPAFYASLASPGARIDAVSARNLINAYRRNLGLPPVEVDAGLQVFAERQADTLAAADRIDATRATPLQKRLATSGIGASRALENVSAGYHSFSDAFSGWRGSPNHDATLRLAGASRMGIATAYNSQSKYKVYWVLVVTEPSR